MKDPRLHQFIEDIMTIHPQIAGMGEVSSGIMGTTGTEGVAGEKLRSDALAFAAAYSQPDTAHEALLERAKQLEGSLLTVKLVNGISDARLEQLVASLHALLQQR